MSFPKDDVLEKLKSTFFFLYDFYKNPIEGIKKSPQINWLEIILIQLIAAFLSGLLSGIISQNLIFLIWGLAFFPLMAVLISFLISLLIHYGVLFLFQREFSFLKAYNLVVLANLPFLAIRTLSPLVESIDIVGFFLTAFLISVGLIEKYQLPKKKVIRYVSLLTLLIVITWLVQFIWRLNQEQDLFPFN